MILVQKKNPDVKLTNTLLRYCSRIVERRFAALIQRYGRLMKAEKRQGLR